MTQAPHRLSYPGTREVSSPNETRTESLNQACEVSSYHDRGQLRVALLSCGLGNVTRGFEMSIHRWYKTLKKEPYLDVRLFSGGKHADSTQVLNIPRDWLLRTVLSPVALVNYKKIWEFAYGVEMVSFSFGVWHELMKWKPDVVFTKEAPLGVMLHSFRKVYRQNFKIIFSNGGGFKPSTYKDFDFIQHLQQFSFDAALEAGIPAEKMSVIPNYSEYVRPVESRDELRKWLGYTDKDWVIICVAAWNRHHKRIDYLIEEAAKMLQPDVRLLLCGHPEPETSELKRMAEKRMPGQVQFCTFSQPDVIKALHAADVFVIPSVNEVLGSATVEAALAGLPVICHPNTGTRFILQQYCEGVDMTIANNLTERLMQLKFTRPDGARLAAISQSVLERFGEDALRGKFIDSINYVCTPESRKAQPRRTQSIPT